MTTANQMPSALLVFSIGPVQDFIVAARRTQDLWMGSYILAYLSAAAMRKVVADTDNPEEVLYPVLKDQPITEKMWNNKAVDPRSLALATLPNKFTIGVNSVSDGQVLARRAESAVHETWREIAEAVEAKFPGALAQVGQDWERRWDKQVRPERWIETYWAVYPYGGQSYGEYNRRAERAFESRKGVRNFIAVEEPGEKCTVCGIRAALTGEAEKPRWRMREEWREIAKTLHERGESNDPVYKGLSAALSGEGNERLCAICTVKRFAQRFYFENKLGLKGGFPSTSSIATIIFRREVMRPAMTVTRKAFTDALETHRVPQTLSRRAFAGLDPQDPLQKYDGDLFYVETYSAKRMQDDYGMDFADNDEHQNLRAIRSAAQVLRREAAKAEIRLPPKYYAVLLMDGDHMGNRLGQANSLEEHRALSESLRVFSVKHVQEIVENQYLGRVVYAGGDDLMAFLPLDTILDAVRDLNRVFQETTGLTASAGIAVAHHTAPLDGVLKAAREAEEKAKESYGRNAVVFTVLRRSGEPLEVGARWEYADTLALVRELRDHFLGEVNGQKVELSPRFAFEAEREARALAKLGRAAHEAALARLLKRHGEGINPELAGKFADLGAGLSGHLPNYALETAHWMLLARFLASAGEEE
jgi:CRISPR-associated protein Cmr2